VFDHDLLPSFKVGDYVRYKTNIITDFEVFFADNKDIIFDMVQTAGT